MASAHHNTIEQKASRRLRRGLLANAMSVVLRIATQLGLLPLLFAYWSEGQVGIWLMLFSLPMIFHIASTVFFAAGSNYALANESCVSAARAAFWASFWLAISTTLALVACGIVTFLFSSFAGAAWVAVFAAAGLIPTLAIFATYVVVSIPMAAMEVPLRHAGRYPDHIALQAVSLACEALAIGIAVVLGAGLLGAAAAMLAVRVVFTLVAFVIAHAINPTIFASEAAWRETARKLVAPALGFMALPLVYALNLSGYTLLIGFAFGPVILATFVATRTLVRLIDLLTNFLFAAQYYEAGHAAGERQEAQEWQRQLLATMTMVTSLFALVFAVAMLSIGPWLQHWWTAGQTEFDSKIALVLIMAGAIRILCASPAALLSAANKHTGFARAYLIGSLVAFGVAMLLAISGASLVAICAMLIVAEITQLIPIMRAALKITNMSSHEFARLMTSSQRLSDVRQLIGTLKPRKNRE